MPRLPTYIAQQPMPTTPGLPRGGTPVPVVPQPLLGDQGPTLLERSLGQGGEFVQQMGQLGLHAADLQRRQQHAQDVLDATLGDQAWAQAFQEQEAALHQDGDYRTLPKDVLDTGTRLLEQVARERNLSPQARAMYQARVQERLTLAQHNALALQGQRRDQDVVYAQSNAVHEALQSVQTATTPYEREVALGRFDETLHAFQATHLANPQALADLRAKAHEGIRENEALVAIRANPLESYGELQGISQAIATGETPVITTPAFQGLTAGQLAKLTDDAWQHLREEGTYREQAVRASEHQQAKDKEAMAQILLADVTSIQPTAANLPTIERQIQRINDAGRQGLITYGQQQSLMNDAQQWKRVAQSPSVLQDNPEVEHRLATAMLLADSPEAFQSLRQDLLQHATLLKPETIGRFDTQLRTRENDLMLTQDEAFKAARQMVVDAVVPEAALLGMPGAAAAMKEEERQKVSDALRALEGEMAPLTPQERKRQYRTLAQNIITQVLGHPAQAGQIKESLPPFLWTMGADGFTPELLPREQAVQEIQRFTRDKVLQGALLRRYDEVAVPLPPLPEKKAPERRGGLFGWFGGGGTSGRRK